MAVQFLLFAGIDAGVLLLLTRQRGIWLRLRSAPLTRGEFNVARALTTRGLAMMVTLLLVMIGLPADRDLAVSLGGVAAGDNPRALEYRSGTKGMMLEYGCVLASLGAASVD